MFIAIRVTFAQTHHLYMYQKFNCVCACVCLCVCVCVYVCVCVCVYVGMCVVLCTACVCVCVCVLCVLCIYCMCVCCVFIVCVCKCVCVCIVCLGGWMSVCERACAHACVWWSGMSLIHSVGSLSDEFLPGLSLWPLIVIQWRFLHVHTVAGGLGKDGSNKHLRWSLLVFFFKPLHNDNHEGKDKMAQYKDKMA